MESNIKLIALLFFGLASCLIYGNDPVDTVADLLHDIVEAL
jgi:lipoprotein